MKIKIFGDGASVNDMIKANKDGIVQGFTTNPSLMKKAGITNYEKFAKEVLKEIIDLPISFEVFSDDFDLMEREALIISSWGKNVNVKIPITNSKGESSIPLIRKLLDKKVFVNVTAILTMEQIQKLSEIIEPEDCVIVSVFAGRIADTGKDPTSIVEEAVRRFYTYEHVQVLWASTRELLNIIQAENCWCDIITVPTNILSKLSMIGKDLTELSLDTVKMFYNDAKSCNYKLI